MTTIIVCNDLMKRKSLSRNEKKRVKSQSWVCVCVGGGWRGKLMALNGTVGTQLSSSKNKVTKTCSKHNSNHQKAIVRHKHQHEPETDSYQNGVYCGSHNFLISAQSSKFWPPLVDSCIYVCSALIDTLEQVCFFAIIPHFPVLPRGRLRDAYQHVSWHWRRTTFDQACSIVLSNTRNQRQ